SAPSKPPYKPRPLLRLLSILFVPLGPYSFPLGLISLVVLKPISCQLNKRLITFDHEFGCDPGSSILSMVPLLLALLRAELLPHTVKLKLLSAVFAFAFHICAPPKL